MKIYEANIYDKEANKNESVHLAIIETEAEQEHYDAEDYDALFRNSGYADEDIFYYIHKSEIPEKNNGHIMAGDIYDYIGVLNTRLIYQTH